MACAQNIVQANGEQYFARCAAQERRTTILEHHLYEKTFVVETRLVGERPLPGDARVCLGLHRTVLVSFTSWERSVWAWMNIRRSVTDAFQYMHMGRPLCMICK